MQLISLCTIRRRRKETSSKHKLARGLFKMTDLKPSMDCKPNPTPPHPLKDKLWKYIKRTTRRIITTNHNVHVKHWGTHSTGFLSYRTWSLIQVFALWRLSKLRCWFNRYELSFSSTNWRSFICTLGYNLAGWVGSCVCRRRPISSSLGE